MLATHVLLAYPLKSNLVGYLVGYLRTFTQQDFVILFGMEGIRSASSLGKYLHISGEFECHIQKHYVVTIIKGKAKYIRRPR